MSNKTHSKSKTTWRKEKEEKRAWEKRKLLLVLMVLSIIGLGIGYIFLICGQKSLMGGAIFFYLCNILELTILPVITYKKIDPKGDFCTKKEAILLTVIWILFLAIQIACLCIQANQRTPYFFPVAGALIVHNIKQFINNQGMLMLGIKEYLYFNVWTAIGGICSLALSVTGITFSIAKLRSFSKKKTTQNDEK